MLNWKEIIFSDKISFVKKAQKVFDYQFEHNSVYRQYCKALGVTDIESPKEAPLLPVRAFKDARVLAVEENLRLNTQDSILFKSSGTSNMQCSVHYVKDASIYNQSLLQGFREFYDLDSSIIWGYMPGYTENSHSSLNYMVQKLMEQDDSGLSHFLPLNEPLQSEEISKVERSGKQLIIFGAAFGLLDLLEMKKIALPSNSIIIETGGMKTHRREISRDELHLKLARGFELDTSRIHSEYGMCELLSQAYATGGKWFHTVPWMNVSIRHPDNPFEKMSPYKEGLVGVIDLANVHSCSFLLTGDRGMIDKKGRFQVMGRWNPQDLRGCNFLIEED